MLLFILFTVFAVQGELFIADYAQRAICKMDVVFNQSIVEDWCGLQEQGAIRRTQVLNSVIIPDADPSITNEKEVDFEDPDSVLELILLSANPIATVYPTERYYYYSFDLGVRKVNGNLRFTDIQEGILHIGYFNNYLSTFDVRSKSYTNGKDIVIKYDDAAGIIVVNYHGIRTIFILNRSMLNNNAEITLQPGEHYVSGIIDESGYHLHLIYYQPEKIFYYILSRSMPRPEKLINYTTSGGLELRIGRRSRFAFFYECEQDRHILVGVLAENIRKNNYFDGPFDQVPPDLQIKKKLEAAYPYVKMNQGIDEHGNFLALEHQRVAISPYQSYESLIQLSTDLDALYRPFKSGVEQWCMLAYEWKRDFHKHLADNIEGIVNNDAYQHDLDRSRTWPSNHWAEQSTSWPRYPEIGATVEQKQDKGEIMEQINKSSEKHNNK